MRPSHPPQPVPRETPGPVRVDVAFTPPPEPPGRRTCLAVDVLRATSVLAVLFGRGVRAVYPCATIEEARDRRTALATAGIDARLSGETNALPPAGFDYGNSPGELERVTLTDTMVMATTNGTPTLIACVGAALTMPAAPLNAGAVVRRAVAARNDVLVVCAGLRGAYAEDDALAAGLLVEHLVRAGFEPGEGAGHALDLYRAARNDVAAAFARTEHGGRLVELGFGDDLRLCATADRYGVTARLTVEEGVAVLRADARDA